MPARRLADLAHDGVPVIARLLVIRQPRIFTEDLPAVPPVRADRTVLVLNQPPGDETEPERYYAVRGRPRAVDRYFGPDVAWAPISTPVREQILAAGAGRSPSPTDWHEIIDVADWESGRERPGAGVPVIGRHGRAGPGEVAADAGELLQAYPDTADVRVRILGGGEIAVDRLGRLPSTWDIVEFGAEPPGTSSPRWTSSSTSTTPAWWRRSGARSSKQWPPACR